MSDEEKPAVTGVERDEKGRVKAGGANLRKQATVTRAKVVSRAIIREMKRRYGPEVGTLKCYIVAMDIMDNTQAKDENRIKAAEFISKRVDGNYVQAIELTGAGGGKVEMDVTGKPDEDLTPEQRLVIALKSLGLVAQHGGLPALGQAGGVGAEPAAGDAGAVGGSGDGEPSA